MTLNELDVFFNAFLKKEDFAGGNSVVLFAADSAAGDFSVHPYVLLCRCCKHIPQGSFFLAVTGGGCWNNGS